MLIMVVGDPIKDKVMRTYDVSSDKYQTGKKVEGGCELRMVKPDKGEKWICILHIISYEGKGLATNPRHFGMKVLAWDSKVLIEATEEEMLKLGRPRDEGTIEGGSASSPRQEKGSEGTIDEAEMEDEGMNSIIEGMNGGVRQAHPDGKPEVEGMIEGILVSTNKKLAHILAILKAKEGLRANNISSITGFSLKSTERYIKMLRDAGLIVFKGAKSTGGYYLSYAEDGQ